MARTVARAASRGLKDGDDARRGIGDEGNGETSTDRREKEWISMRRPKLRCSRASSLPMMRHYAVTQITEIPADTSFCQPPCVYSHHPPFPRPLPHPLISHRTHVLAFLLLIYSANSRLIAKFGSGIIGSVARSTRESMGETEAHGRATEALVSMADSGVDTSNCAVTTADDEEKCQVTHSLQPTRRPQFRPPKLRNRQSAPENGASALISCLPTPLHQCSRYLAG